MKLLFLLVSLLLGGAVLLFFVRPWEGMQSIENRAATPTPPPSAREATSAIETGPKPATTDPSNAAQPAEPKPNTPQAGEPKTHRLASEQVEAERNASLDKQEHAITPPPSPTKRYFKVKVRDAGTLEADLPTIATVVIRIDGIKAREADETCKKENGATWPCGAQARAALVHLIRYRAVTCTLPPGGERADFAARCSVTGKDLSTWLVRQGWATPKEDAEPALAEALQAAKTERLGLWSGE